MEHIKKFGIIGEERYKFIFNQNNNYKVNNNGLNITKIKSDWNGSVIGDKEIPKNKITKWKIKINSNIRDDYDDMYIGIGNNNSKGTNDIWSIYSHCSKVQICLQGNCIKYNNHKETLKKGDIIEVIVDRISNKLSFFVNDVDFGIACSDLPKDKELYPAILLYEENLNVELI